MKHIRRQMALLMTAAFLCSLFSIPSLAAQNEESGQTVPAEPTCYTLSVDGNQTSLWAYQIDGSPYFKLRDLAMALTGTQKQFAIAWTQEDDTKQVILSPDIAYAPVGGELSAPAQTGITIAKPADTRFFCNAGWAAILSYVVCDNHYVRLSDLAGTLKCTASYDETAHTAQINTTPKAGSTETQEDLIDNVALQSAGNSSALDADGTVTLRYHNGATTAKAPLTLQPSGSETGQSIDEAGFYLSDEITAIAYGGENAAEIYVITSSDLGATWNHSQVIARGIGARKLYVGFTTPENGWLVVCTFHGMGSEDHFLYLTADGGATWTQAGNPNALYARVATGAGFATDQIGFLCLRTDFADFSPAVCRTQDGGRTWEKCSITLPEQIVQDKSITPLSPVFYGANGLLPVELSDGETCFTVYLTSSDYGETWAYDDSLPIAYHNLGLTVLLPADYAGAVRLTPDGALDENTVIEAYQVATYEKYPGAGLLFRIVRHTPAAFEDYWPQADMIGGSMHFAKDDSYYYSVETPTDVQADVETPGVLEAYQALYGEITTDVLPAFIQANNLTAYDHSVFYQSDYTYPGNHALFTAVLSNDAVFQVVLSQPVAQGEGGIWCVERMTDENNNLYIAMPQTDLTAMEYYTQMQAQADAGYDTGMLDPQAVALTYLDEVWGWASHLASYTITYSTDNT